jgi:hypothetical protein
MSEGAVRTASATILGKAGNASRAGHRNGLQESPRRLVFIGWTSRLVYLPRRKEGNTSWINVSLSRSSFFLPVVIPANRHSAPTLRRPECEDLTLFFAD